MDSDTTRAGQPSGEGGDEAPMCPKHQIPCVRVVYTCVCGKEHGGGWVCEACSRDIVVPAF